ncbi:3'-5' exonuclease [Fluviicola sp.]|uniref:3'-5' exonuclease n=1 Tax=Fluviicola sp. TaxID=1917219 RepID=UPI0031D771B2
MAYYFKLPLITEMTSVQQSTLDEPNPVAINGGPGTGKSIVALWRHIRTSSLGSKTSLLLTYTKTLEYCLSSWASKENTTAGINVHRTKSWTEGYMTSFDEIIIDEAQDLTSDHYSTLKEYSDSISYGADDQQILYPSQATTEAQLRELFPDNEPFELDQNFRNSYEILRFVSATLPNYLISQKILSELQANKTTGTLPQCIVTGGHDKKEKSAILNVINLFKSDRHNIGILYPLTKDVDKMHTFLEQQGVVCSSYHYKRNTFETIENVHVTTFKSSKGIEFDTVIIPNFSNYKHNIATLDICEENDYYVALTRAKRNLYLLCAEVPTGINASTFQTTIL